MFQTQNQFFFVITAELSSQIFTPVLSKSFGPGHAKTSLMPYANNKGARSVCVSAQSDQHLYNSLLR